MEHKDRKNAAFNSPQVNNFKSASTRMEANRKALSATA
jgi:hypothetical protein